MKAVKLRIKSVRSTMQITKAMELVASSKLRRAKERSENCRPYFKELFATLRDIACGNTDFSSVYASVQPGKKVCYVVMAGDRGLAGGYNSNLFKCLEADAAGREAALRASFSRTKVEAPPSLTILATGLPISFAKCAIQPAFTGASVW